MANKHYNETQLNNFLKRYVEDQLNHCKSKLEFELNEYKNSDNWLIENKESTQRAIQLFQMKVNFYQTQLNNLK